MNNKDPQWRQEMADILKMLETAEGRLHEALKESHFSSNQSNDNIKNDNVLAPPLVGSSSKVHKVIFEPYDYTKVGFRVYECKVPPARFSFIAPFYWLMS